MRVFENSGNRFTLALGERITIVAMRRTPIAAAAASRCHRAHDWRNALVSDFGSRILQNVGIKGSPAG
jgi:hypothetical protein